MNILLTAIGSFSADCVVASLKRQAHSVIGCDIYPSIWHPVSKDCSKVYQVPIASNEREYIKALLDICMIEKIEIVFPLTDLEIDVLNKFRDVFKLQNILLCIQSEYCLSIARNKYEMSNLFSNDSIINIPKSTLAKDIISEIRLPAIAKPYNGRSSEGLLILRKQDELRLIEDKEKYIIQEMLSGSVFTVDYVRDVYGKDFAIPREELLRTKNGAGITVRVIGDEVLQSMASYIGSALGVIGCVNMEFIKNGDKYYLIDINPRFSAGVAFSYKAGYDMVLNHLNSFLNKSIEKPICLMEKIIAKRYNEDVLWEE